MPFLPRRPKSRRALTRRPRRFTPLVGERLEERLPLALAPHLLLDINRGPAGIEVEGSSQEEHLPSKLGEANGIVYFSGNANGLTNTGYELWRSDGTAAGTALVKDIYAGGGSSNPHEFANVNGTMFFLADSDLYFGGPELWKTDGTSTGTVFVKNLFSNGVPSPQNLTNVGGTLFFAARNNTDGVELWKSDGTAAGTVMVSDIAPGAASSSPRNLVSVGGQLFFIANENELWKSDGTAAGTVKLKEFATSGASGGPTELTNVNGRLFLAANDGANGYELWKSDGTKAGTVLVKDILGGQDSSSPKYLTAVGESVFFAASDGTRGIELWKSDGTSSGTVLVRDLYAGGVGSRPQCLTNVSGELFFAASDSNGLRLWKSDGSGSGTQMVQAAWDSAVNTHLESLRNVNGSLFFFVNDLTRGNEVWKSDGTSQGTVLVQTIARGQQVDMPRYSTPVGGKLLFSATDGTSVEELWVSDGSTLGTHLIPRDAASTASAFNLYRGEMEIAGSVAYFNADDGVHGRELWKTDGTAEGTVLVKDIMAGSGSSGPRYLVNVNGTLFFVADDGISGEELWKSDGTAAGTVRVTDIQPGASGAVLSYLSNIGGTLFFRGFASNSNAYLWRSDGTASGTYVVKDVRVASSVAPHFTNVNGTLFFVADDYVHGYELWKSDGTTNGTVLVKDILPGSGRSYTHYLTNFNGTLFFTADDGSSGLELWKSDGTEQGTSLVKDIWPGASSSLIGNLTAVGGTLYLTANDGVHGVELWASDGTALGTRLVRDIYVGSNNTFTSSLMNLNGTLLFMADDDNQGSDLWQSDGSTEGTVRVKELSPFTFGGRGAWEINGNVLFSVYDATHGQELWKSNGTAAGTVPLIETAPGSSSSDPADVFSLGGQILFVANDLVHGRELFTTYELNGEPDGTDKDVTIAEDTSIALTIEDFGFTDPYDFPANSLKGVKIGVVQGADFISYNGRPLRDADFITASEIQSGGLVFAPPPNANGTALTAFSFQVQDDGGTASGAADTDRSANTITFNVTAVNDPPVTVGEAYSTSEDRSLTVPVALGLLVNDTDVEGDSLVAVRDTSPAHGFLSLSSNGRFTYRPAINFNGLDSFTYHARDFEANGNTVTIFIAVAAVNDAPTFAKGPNQQVAQNSGPQSISGWAKSISAGPSDEAGQALTFLVSSDNPDLFAAQPAVDSSGRLTYTPVAHGRGTAVVTVTLKDSGGTADGGIDTSLPQTFTIQVLSDNPNPIAASLNDNQLVVAGSPFDDNIMVDQLGQPGADVRVLESGNVIFTFASSAVTSAFVNAGAGNDVVTIDPSFGTRPATLLGSDGNDTLSGGLGNDYLDGMDGDDSVNGNGGDDMLIGSAGVDAFDGGSGNDTVNGDAADASAGSPKILGGAGSDFLNFPNETAGVFFDNQGPTRVSTPALQTGGFEAIWGGSGNDTITNAGGTTAVQIIGWGGNDTLTGGEGNDLISGVDGDDILVGNGGDDELNGKDAGFGASSGLDKFSGGAGSDIVRADALDMGAGRQILGGAAPGSDFLDLSSIPSGVNLTFNDDMNPALATGIGGWESIYSGNGNDAITVTNATANDGVYIVGFDGNDVLTGGAGPDILRGGAGDDLLIGRGGADEFIGSEGIDTVDYSGSPQGPIPTHPGFDGVVADLRAGGRGFGNDAAGDFSKTNDVENIIGSPFNDYIIGNLLDNVIDGGAGNDKIIGNQGNDTLTGGLGDDELMGSDGVVVTDADKLDGGAGDDTIYADAADLAGASALVLGGGGTDFIDFVFSSGGITFVNDFTAGATKGGFENVFGNRTGNDNISTIGPAPNLQYVGWGGDDTLVGGSGEDNLNGADGNDTLTGDGGADLFQGGAGTDTMTDFNAGQGDQQFGIP